MTNDLITTDELPKSLADIELDDLGRRAKAFLTKSDDYLKSAGLCLLEAQKRVKKNGGIFVEWLKEHCDIGRSRAYELIAIGDGSKTVASLRLETKERVEKHVAKKVAKAASVLTESKPTLAAPVESIKAFDIDDADVLYVENIDDFDDLPEPAPVIPAVTAPVNDGVAASIAASIAAVSLDPPDFDKRLADAYCLGVKDGYSEGFAAGVASVTIPEPAPVVAETLPMVETDVHQGADIEPALEAPAAHEKPVKKYAELKPVFLKAASQSQLNTVYKTRETNPAKVAEYRQALECGDCEFPAIFNGDNRAKLAALDIPEPPRKQIQNAYHVKAWKFMQDGFERIMDYREGSDSYELARKAHAKLCLDEDSVWQCFKAKEDERTALSLAQWRAEHPGMRPNKCFGTPEPDPDYVPEPIPEPTPAPVWGSKTAAIETPVEPVAEAEGNTEEPQDISPFMQKFLGIAA